MWDSDLFIKFRRIMDKNKILEIIYTLTKMLEQEEELEDNDLVECIWEDENGNGIYKFK